VFDEAFIGLYHTHERGCRALSPTVVNAGPARWSIAAPVTQEQYNARPRAFIPLSDEGRVTAHSQLMACVSMPSPIGRMTPSY